MNKLPTVALLGLGYWGQNILRALGQIKLSKFLVYDLDQKRLEKARSLVPHVQPVSKWEEVLSNPEVQGVCIASPVECHAAHVISALKAGKHVFVEKPLCRSVREGEEIALAAASSGKHVMVGHIYIHHPAIKMLKSWIEEGKLGDILWVRSSRCSLGPRVRTDVDVLWDYAIHDVYLIPFLLNQKVTSSRAFGVSFLHKPNVDWVEFSMQFDGNSTVMHGFVSWLNPYKERVLMVVGSKGIAVFDELAKPCLRFYQCGFAPHQGLDAWGNSNLRLFDDAKEEFDLPTSQTLSIELQHFVDHLTKEVSPRASLADGLTTLRVLETLSRSLSEKGIWISTSKN